MVSRPERVPSLQDPWHPGQVGQEVYIDDRYRVLRPLGEGAFATVQLCADEWNRGRLVAIKGVSTALSTHQQRSLMHEFVNARRLSHRNLVSVLDTGVCRRHGLYVVLEYVDGPDLVTVLEEEEALPVDVAAEAFRQVAQGLGHMHQLGLVHRDVKPDNIFLAGARAKLGDFGASRVALADARATVIFTPGYAAPETSEGRVGPAADAYALGAAFHLAVTGHLPPTRTVRARKAAVSPRMRLKGGPRAAALAARLLTPNPKLRLHDMREVARRFAALTRPSSRRRLKAVVERTDLKRQRAELERRQAEFERRFASAMAPFPLEWVCVECRGPVSEAMLFCPWCGDLLRFRSEASFPRYCERCEHGLHEGWSRCPWCGEHYPAAEPQPPAPARDARYEDACTRCHGPMMRFMSFCPWCGEPYTWHTRGMEEDCESCGFTLEKNLFAYCPWCGDLHDADFAEQARERIDRREQQAKLIKVPPDRR